jgi:hypothetical protein
MVVLNTVGGILRLLLWLLRRWQRRLVALISLGSILLWTPALHLERWWHRRLMDLYPSTRFHPPPLPSPPHRPPRGASQHRQHFEMRITPRSAAVDATEVALANTLVATVAGTRPFLSPAQMADHPHRCYNVEEQSA